MNDLNMTMSSIWCFGEYGVTPSFLLLPGPLWPEVCIYSTPTLQAGCDARSKMSSTGLNSEISFSQTGCHTKVKELSMFNSDPERSTS